jgi:hypothetical protein
MKRLVIPVLSAVLCLLVADVASADAPRLDARDLIRRIAGGSDPVPAEWSGVWSTVDSLYDCNGVFQQTFSSIDTLCTGQAVEPDPDPEFTYECNGTITATTVNITCTGSSEVFPDCTANFVVTQVGTRTADSYFMVITTNTTFSGTGKGCDQFPAQCMQFNTHGTRIAPEPTAYCATPVEPTTWGKLKSRYH